MSFRLLPCGRFILKRPVVLRRRLPTPNTRFGFLTSPLPFWAVRGGGPRFPMPPVVSGRWCCLKLSAVNARRWRKSRATLRKLLSPDRCGPVSGPESAEKKRRCPPRQFDAPKTMVGAYDPLASRSDARRGPIQAPSQGRRRVRPRLSEGAAVLGSGAAAPLPLPRTGPDLNLKTPSQPKNGQMPCRCRPERTPEP